MNKVDQQMRRWASTLGCSLALAACVESKAVVQQPAASLPSAGALHAAGNGGSKRQFGEVPGVDVLAGGGVDAFNLEGATELVSLERTQVTGQPFAKAIRTEIKERPKNLWDIQLSTTNASEVRTGDALLVSFWFRKIPAPMERENREAQTEVNFELNSEPFEKSLTRAVRAGREWTHILVPFVAKRDFEVGKAKISFRLGYTPQTVEFADIRVENFEKRLALADLPRTRTVYGGMEADAPWRAKAAERIDKLRKADLSVRVVGSDGKPMANADVTVQLTRHAFHFGTAVPGEYMLDKGHEQFNELFFRNFNMGTLENDLKWEVLEDGGYSLDRGVRAVDVLLESKMRVRCHRLMGLGWDVLPARLAQFKADRAAFLQAVADNIRRMVTTLKGRCEHWDVVNEPFTSNGPLALVGEEAMADWFKLARSIDPKAKLFINDFAILNGGGGTTAHRDYYESVIKLLIDKGAPLDGIGMQGHFGTALTSPDDLMTLLDRYAKFGKEIAVTEFDVVMDDEEELVGRYVRDFYTTLFSHPAVTTLVMWGFWDTNHWQDNAVMYHGDFSLKPGGRAYQDLVLGEWLTKEAGVTDENGVFETRGFRGDYDIAAKAGERTRAVKAVLANGGSRVDIRL